MRLTIFSAGLRGDIQPFVALGRGLQQEGYSVRMAVPENFANFIKEQNLDYYPLRGDVQQIVTSEKGRAFMESRGKNLIKNVRAINILFSPIVMQMAEDAYAACRKSDAIICAAVRSPFGHSIAKTLDIPLIYAEPTPILPTKACPAPGWPIQTSFGGLYNRLTGHLMLQVIWRGYHKFVNRFREQLGLKPYTSLSFLRVLKSFPLLGAYSPSVFPHPPDWPDSVHITGYWFLDSKSSWIPPDTLEAFLNSGSPPVYIGFGSMAGLNPEWTTTLILKALEKSKQRGIILTGWGGIKQKTMHNDVYMSESIPHNWLFPRMAAVVHHGGAGTTAEGLRAGVPSVITPFMVDQMFWGRRIRELGVGLEPLSYKKLTVNNLASAIQLAVTHRGIRKRAKAFAGTIRAEDGLTNAVKIINRYLRNYH